MSGWKIRLLFFSPAHGLALLYLLYPTLLLRKVVSDAQFLLHHFNLLTPIRILFLIRTFVLKVPLSLSVSRSFVLVWSEKIFSL